MILNSDNASPLSQEKEAELLEKFKVVSQHEMRMIETVLAYMAIYQSALDAEQAGEKKRSKKYLKQLYKMPKDFALKRDKWIQSVDQIQQFVLSHGLSHEKSSAEDTTSNELATSNDVGEASVALQQKYKSHSFFEAYVFSCIDSLEGFIAEVENEKGKENEVKYIAQVAAWKEIKKGWETILELRQTLLKRGGNDFFELFDDSMKARSK